MNRPEEISNIIKEQIKQYNERTNEFSNIKGRICFSLT